MKIIVEIFLDFLLHFQPVKSSHFLINQSSMSLNTDRSANLSFLMTWGQVDEMKWLYVFNMVPAVGTHSGSAWDWLYSCADHVLWQHFPTSWAKTEPTPTHDFSSFHHLVLQTASSNLLFCMVCLLLSTAWCWFLLFLASESEPSVTTHNDDLIVGAEP